MHKEIEIDGRNVEFTANAATPFRFKQVFRKDLLTILGSGGNEGESIEAVMQLAFIMAKQAEKTDMNKLNEEMFITWLEGFSPMAFIDKAEDILSVYTDSTLGTSTP